MWGRTPTTATVTLAVDGENEAGILEGLVKPRTEFVDVVPPNDDGTVRATLGLVAADISLEPRDTDVMDADVDTPDEHEPPAYDTFTDVNSGRVDTSEWDIDRDMAGKVYESLIDRVSAAIKDGEPSVVVVGRPQYKALWVYVSEVYDEPAQPEQLVPLRMIVVPGPQLHVETRNIDVLYDTGE